jgi:hypothetical protein
MTKALMRIVLADQTSHDAMSIHLDHDAQHVFSYLDYMAIVIAPCIIILNCNV